MNSVLRSTLRGKSVAKRAFQSVTEFDHWKDKILSSRIRSPDLNALDLKAEAPFLQSVSPLADHLRLFGSKKVLECVYPLKQDELLRNTVSDFSNWSSFRLGKFYETVDALTADVAYRYSNYKFTLVTAGHYHSRKLRKTNIHEDVAIRCYVTSVGRSSLEIRTDVLQYHGDEEVLVNVCHTIMVALDPETGKSVGKVGKSLPIFEPTTADEKERHELAAWHQNIRQERTQSTMLLRNKISKPPSDAEMDELHQLHRRHTYEQEAYHQAIPKVSDYTFRSSTVIFPEQRNVHGKLFGGFVMEEAQKLAQYTASFWAQGNQVFGLGIDEAVFLQPINIGDMVTFTARCVHSTEHSCRVLVVVEVRDPKNRDRVPIRSNRLLFVFGGRHFPPRILPVTYSEILMSFDARRRHAVEGPTQEEVYAILNEPK